jgi:hypothetical protein
MALSFTSIPLEIRLKIYELLLLDRNVVTWTERFGRLPGDENFFTERLYPLYTTSLFTVSKVISEESLRYFYTQNAFIAIESSIPHFF